MLLQRQVKDLSSETGLLPNSAQGSDGLTSKTNSG